MRRLLFIIQVFAIMLCTVAPASAGIDFYANCVKNYDYGNIEISVVKVTPINSVCQSTCLYECSVFSRLDRMGNELNDDIIQDCLTSCQKGEVIDDRLFTSYYYEEITRNGIWTQVVTGPLGIQKACNDAEEKNFNAEESKISGLKNGDKLKIKLANGEQKVYLCGKKIVKLRPLIKSLDPGVWNSNAKQTLYQKKDEHMCFNDISAERFDDLTFKDLWNEFKKPQYADEKYDKCRWNARNYNLIATGIYPQNNDELSISWRGDYARVRTDIGTRSQPRIVNLTRDACLFCLDPANNSVINSSSKEDCKENFRTISGIQFFNKRFLDNDERMQKNVSVVYGEDMRGPLDVNKLKAKTCNYNNAPPKEPLLFKGLIGNFIDENMQLQIISSNPRCAKETNYACDNINACFALQTVGQGNYNFSGKLSNDHTLKSGGDLSFSVRNPLYLRHHDFIGNISDANFMSYYMDNVGGYDLDITWGGCPKEDGENLQYAVWNPNQLIPETAWQDLPLSNITSGTPIVVLSTYTGEEGGTLFLRIKSDSGVPPLGYYDFYTNVAHRFGEYNVAIQKYGEYGTVDKNSVFRQLVIIVKETLLGYVDPRGKYVDGATQIIYKGVVKDFRFIQLVQALLILYIALQAISFGIGVININQKELVIRILKIALIITIISPNSWEFLYFNFLKAFIEGSIELIALIVSSAYPDVPGIDIKADPTMIFAVFGAVNKMIFNNAIWIKISALMIHGVVGFMIALMIIIAIIVYWLCIVRAIVIYIFSLVGISLLILLAPIFIPLMLFKMTENFFSSWWKLLISFAMQPVLVFTTITIFNVIIIILLYSSLNFTACKGCLWRVTIGVIGYDQCWIPAYRIAETLHRPSEFAGANLPLNVLGAGLAFLLLAHGMWIFTTFITEIASRIFTQMAVQGAMLGTREESVRAGAIDTAKFAAIDAPVAIAAKLQKKK